MQIMLGWSEELASSKWIKVEITLDETDMARLLAEDPEKKAGTTSEAFLTLEAECKRLLMAEVRWLKAPPEGRPPTPLG